MKVEVLSNFASIVSRQISETVPQKVYVYKTFFFCCIVV
jgi:hypothetical protein